MLDELNARRRGGQPCATEELDAPQPGGQAAERLRLRERALTLYCHGERARTIAATLAVSESTVRRWLREDVSALAEDARLEGASRLLRAIESQRAIAAAAWEAYERAHDAAKGGHAPDDEPADAEEDAGDGDAEDRAGGSRGRRARRGKRGAERAERQERAGQERGGQGARYLAVALAAQREVARLQGLYARLTQDAPEVHVTLTRRPDGPENAPAGE